MLTSHSLAHPFTHLPPTQARAHPRTPVLLGGAAIALADFAYCLAFWAPHGVTPARVFQGVASGLLGADAYRGGAASAVLGAGLQWAIGCAFVLAYALVARHMPLLLRQPRYGIAYGLLMYAVMNRIVVPLSAFPQPAQPDVAWMLLSIPMFACFGMVAALFARSAVR